MNLKDSVKQDLGISHNKKDGDIDLAIRTAKQRLSQIGVSLVREQDPATITAIKLYCRSWFNFQGDGERYMKAFEGLANSMSQAGEYRGLTL